MWDTFTPEQRKEQIDKMHNELYWAKLSPIKKEKIITSLRKGYQSALKDKKNSIKENTETKDCKPT